MSTDPHTDAAPPAADAVYTHGHAPAVLRSHTWRTAANSAAYLLPHLAPTARILDVGCGPGTISADLAAAAPQGHVTALDAAPAALAAARAHAASRGITNISFVEGDAYALPFEDGAFDVVHAHQVLQHVARPAAVLAELARVTRAGGLVAARDVDFGSMAWFPESAGMTSWHALYHTVARANGGEPDAGRRMLAWTREAGFARAGVVCSAGTWCYCTPEERAWWGGLWAERTLQSNFATTARAQGVAEEELQAAAQAWEAWAADEDAWFAMVHGEILYTKP